MLEDAAIADYSTRAQLLISEQTIHMNKRNMSACTMHRVYYSLTRITGWHVATCTARSEPVQVGRGSTGDIYTDNFRHVIGMFRLDAACELVEMP